MNINKIQYWDNISMHVGHFYSNVYSDPKLILNLTHYFKTCE